MIITFKDNSDEVLAAMESACNRALEKCGLVGEGYAKKLCPVDTGNLRNSITHTVSDGEKPHMSAQIANTAYPLSAEPAHITLAADKRRGYTKTKKEIGI